MKTCLHLSICDPLVTPVDVIDYLFATKGHSGLMELVSEEQSVHGILAKMILGLRRAFKEEMVASSLGNEIEFDKDVPVLLMDHGTPSVEVNVTRKLVASLLRQHPSIATQIIDCSMENPLEKRLSHDEMENKRLNFNYPTLAEVFTAPFGFTPSSTKRIQYVVICYLFLAPGRHAGEDGDIEQILEEQRLRCLKEMNIELRFLKTKLVGDPSNHPQLIELLVDRIRAIL